MSGHTAEYHRKKQEEQHASRQNTAEFIGMTRKGIGKTALCNKYDVTQRRGLWKRQIVVPTFDRISSGWVVPGQGSEGHKIQSSIGRQRSLSVPSGHRPLPTSNLQASPTDPTSCCPHRIKGEAIYPFGTERYSPACKSRRAGRQHPARYAVLNDSAGGHALQRVANDDTAVGHFLDLSAVDAHAAACKIFE